MSNKKHHFEFMSVLALFVGISVYAMALFFNSIDVKLSIMKASTFEVGDVTDISEIDKFKGLYTDIDLDSKYYEAASYFYNEGYLDRIKAFSDGVFGIDELISRSELLSFVGDLYHYDLTTGDYDDCFVDVDGDAEPFICYAYVNDIVNGVGNKAFAPDGEVSLRAFLKIVLNSSKTDLAYESLAEDAQYIVEESDWVFPYYKFVSDNDVISISDVADLDESVKRGDMIEMLYKLNQI